MFRRRKEHLTWTRCHNVLTRAEDVCAENVSVTQKATQNRRRLVRFTTSSMIIYTAAGTLPIKKNDYSHGSRFPCQKVYIHGCRASSIKVLLTRQPFLKPKGLYTRLPCIKYKSAIYTTGVPHAKRFIYMAAVHPV